MRPLLVVLLDKRVEARLLLQEIRGARLGGLVLSVRCMRSCRPFCSGCPGQSVRGRCPAAATTRPACSSRRAHGPRRPSFLPRARAAAIPDRTRSRISSRSNSAIVAKIPKASRPFGVDVSTPSCRDTNWMPGLDCAGRCRAADCERTCRIGKRRRIEQSPPARSEQFIEPRAPLFGAAHTNVYLPRMFHPRRSQYDVARGVA